MSAAAIIKPIATAVAGLAAGVWAAQSPSVKLADRIKNLRRGYGFSRNDEAPREDFVAMPDGRLVHKSELPKQLVEEAEAKAGLP